MSLLTGMRLCRLMTGRGTRLGSWIGRVGWLTWLLMVIVRNGDGSSGSDGGGGGEVVEKSEMRNAR